VHRCDSHYAVVIAFVRRSSIMVTLYICKMPIYIAAFATSHYKAAEQYTNEYCDNNKTLCCCSVYQHPRNKSPAMAMVFTAALATSHRNNYSFGLNGFNRVSIAEVVCYQDGHSPEIRLPSRPGLKVYLASCCNLLLR
jgi:hypothetical protein